YTGAYGRIAFYPRGHELAHDLKFGPGFSTWLVLQWLDKDKLVAVWPDGWEGVRYEGVEKYKLPPWVVKQWKKSN
ncbi:MAG: hypothetical protein NTV01_07080, partial [Bacteroidia bacterium]|nr:hypothetical protein [Bacteroidia bacterium]